MKEKEVFLRYKEFRDVIFVLGAGASYPDGVPLQKDILPYILSGNNKEISESLIGTEVTQFIRDNFYYNSAHNNYPKIESLFGFLDYFIQHKESLNRKYNSARIVEIKEHLIKLVHFVVNEKTEKESPIYRKFWENINELNRNISLITLNYDTLPEQAFNFMFRKRGYLDYSFHLMNYDNLDELKPFNFWINPNVPISINEGDNPVPFKIIKLHGSLNWKYCNCCNQVLLTPWDREIDLNKGTFWGYTYPEKEKYELACPLDQTEFQTLIIPPSFVKYLTHPIMSQLMSEASREIRKAKKIVFIGYSLSDPDLHIKALFKKHLNENVKIYVVNKKISNELQTRFLSLSKNVEFIDILFEDFVFDKELNKIVLSC